MNSRSSNCININNFTLPKEQTAAMTSKTLNTSEASLSMHFWNQMITTLFLNEKYPDDRDIVSELHGKRLLELGKKNRLFDYF